MIKMDVVKKDADGIKNQFVVKADEPITIEMTETENGHTVAHIYRGTETDEYSEPIGAFDSAIEQPKGWKVE